ncbi:MAG: alpha/beta hydrolase [Dehalococcoidia bacterium]
MPTVVIIVHGRNQQRKDPVALEAQWEGALLSGLKAVRAGHLDREQILFPFYGDLYDDYGLATRLPTTIGDKRKRVRFEREVASEISAKLKARRAKPPAASKRREGEAAVGLFDPLINAFDRVPGVSGPFLRLIFRDVYDYLHDVGGIRRKTMERVIPVIRANRKNRIVLVGHSLGSVVTYDILNTHPELRVDLFVTIGSPLGIDKAVRQRLLPSRSGKRVVPTGVGSWLNAADQDDYVALDDTLADDFKGSGKAIVTDIRVRNPKGHSHSGEGYISQRKVCTELAKLL